jgi:hypothetical protein
MQSTALHQALLSQQTGVLLMHESTATDVFRAVLAPSFVVSVHLMFEVCLTKNFVMQQPQRQQQRQ